MAKLIFEGSTHAELVQQVRGWLTDVDGTDVLEGTIVVESPTDSDLQAGQSPDDRSDVLRDLLRSLRKIAPGVVENEAQLLALLARISGFGSPPVAESESSASVSNLLQWFVEATQKANAGNGRDRRDEEPEDNPADDSKDW